MFNQRGFSCFPPAGCCGSVSVAPPAGEHLSLALLPSHSTLSTFFGFLPDSDYLFVNVLNNISCGSVSVAPPAGAHLPPFLVSASEYFFGISP